MPHYAIRVISSATNYISFDVSTDGARCAILSTTNEETSAPLEVIVNWDSELKKK